MFVLRSQYVLLEHPALSVFNPLCPNSNLAVSQFHSHHGGVNIERPAKQKAPGSGFPSAYGGMKSLTLASVL